ncbi:MAG TPA: hypothetical protein VGO33_12160 [Gemmatimonadaceae bacterium]|jgi:hypothetical protein|nr:hypothetical protein [Gemmatimonadaceae bacterium]
MKAISRSLVTSILAANAIVGVACTSAVTLPAIPDDQPSLLRADSAAFVTIVRMELSGSGKSYPHEISPVRFDSHPNGQASDFPISAGGSTGSIPGTASARDSVTTLLVSQQRKAILRNLGVEEGGPFNYPQCRGLLAPPTVPPMGCPKEDQYYVTIGLPYLGIPSDLPIRATSSDTMPDVSGEIWTVIVTEAYASRLGQNSFQHAWLLRRDPVNRRFTLAHTVLLSWVE